ncbi:MAG: hypothetical protein NTW48_02645 [Chloroflexi bacterium]|nr:hypothetical protein [Chloroflexota bacterium]
MPRASALGTIGADAPIYPRLTHKPTHVNEGASGFEEGQWQ